MDFELSEEQTAIAGLAEEIFAGSANTDAVRAVEHSDDRFDERLWRQLGAANLLGIGVPEAHGGIGLGIVELCLVLEQQGRRVAPVPLLYHSAFGALPLAEFASADLLAAVMPGVVDGEFRLTAAFAEPGANNVLRSSVRAELDPDDEVWRLRGTKIAVPAALTAHALLVPADTEHGLTVFLVAADDEGLAFAVNETTNRELHATVSFDDVEVASGAVVGEVGGGADVVGWAMDRIELGICALALGACEEALAMAAAYTSQREQFGRPLSTNQGVAIRAADAYIDIECMRVTLWQAAWRLDAGLPARDQIDVAKYWSAEGGQRVVHATQHLHGGMGADVDYPVHR
jgi:alkylation response protein AidB-like acyl-CoA dehydrogenase